jgi:phytoene dehydrogenase-like protein
MGALRSDACDVLVIGGGVSGLICALLLARSGLSVQVIEEKPVVGGMHRAEYPFSKAPRLGTYTGAHRIGFVPSDLAAQIGVTLPIVPRDPSIFIPTAGPGRYLLAGAGSEGLRAAAGGVMTERDAQALTAMHGELDALVADLAPAWTAAPMALEEISERYVRPALREVFVKLCRGSFAEYAARFGIQGGLLKAALASDALGYSFASWDTPGSGAPLLTRHAAGSLAGGGDAIAEGGLSALTRVLADAAEAAGASLQTSSAVTKIIVKGNTVTSVVLADGTERLVSAVVTSTDPWRLRALVGADRLPADYLRRIDAFQRPGGIAKLNVALTELPRFACLHEERGQHRATTFLLPTAGDAESENGAVRSLGRAFAEASAGSLPSDPPLECTFPTALEPGLRDTDGRHSAAIVIPWVPYDLAGTTWSAEEERFTAALLGAVERFAPGTRELVVETTLYHPKKIETHFGVTRGQLGHVDDTFLFGDRIPTASPISGLYTCGRGSSPAGGVFGVAGVNAARRVLADLELALEQTDVGLHALD